ETGCVRQREDWTAGMSTYLFGLFQHADMAPTNAAPSARRPGPSTRRGTDVAHHQAAARPRGDRRDGRAGEGRPTEGVLLGADPAGRRHAKARLHGVLPSIATLVPGSRKGAWSSGRWTSRSVCSTSA